MKPLYSCMAHLLDGMGSALTKEGFNDRGLLFSLVSVISANKHASRRRGCFAFLRTAWKTFSVLPKVDDTHWTQRNVGAFTSRTGWLFSG